MVNSVENPSLITLCKKFYFFNLLNYYKSMAFINIKDSMIFWDVV